MSNPNRRRTQRLLTCVPAGVQTSEKDRLGLIRDASIEGASVFSQSRFNVDDAVTLNIRVGKDDSETVEVKGRIVRVERLRDGIWTFGIGVRFVPRRDDLGPLFKQLAERQEKLFGPSGP